jgi:hypothetical protein
VSVAHSLSARLFVVVLPLLLLIEKLSSRMRDAGLFEKRFGKSSALVSEEVAHTHTHKQQRHN